MVDKIKVACEDCGNNFYILLEELEDEPGDERNAYDTFGQKCPPCGGTIGARLS